MLVDAFKFFYINIVMQSFDAANPPNFFRDFIISDSN